MNLSQEAVAKACCADLYQSQLARMVLGDNLHPGGLALTNRLGKLMGIRQGDWVYIDAPSGADNREPESVLETLGVKPHNAKSELFNLRKDSNQTNNVVNVNPERAQALKALLTKYRTESASVARDDLR